MKSRDDGGGIWDCVKNLGEAAYNFGKETFSNPYDSLCDLSDLAKDTVKETIVLASLPAQAMIAAGTVALSGITNVIIPDDPYSSESECPCKESLLDITPLISIATKGISTFNHLAVSGIKGYTDEALYTYDPTKVGAVVGTISSGLLYGLEEGMLDAFTSTVDTVARSWNLLGNKCKFDDNQEIVDSSVRQVIDAVSNSLDMLKDLDECAKTIGKLFAVAEREQAIATLRSQVNNAKSKWDAITPRMKLALLPDPISEEESNQLKEELWKNIEGGTQIMTTIA